MIIRLAKKDDAPTLMRLFYDTVRVINRRDYSVEQVAVWAPDDMSETHWRDKQDTRQTFVAEIAGVVVGFAEWEARGYINCFYTHKDYQRQGVGNRLLEAVFAEAGAQAVTEITTEASITARPFFEHHGFCVVRAQYVQCGGVTFRNFLMMRVFVPAQKMNEYLRADPWIEAAHSEIVRIAKRFVTPKDAYHFVRDEIRHSYDIRANEMTATASQVLASGHGICYAKAHLLAAVLRAMGVPAGLAYQRLVLFDDPKDGHSLHSVNTVYLANENRWIRVDARGNKPGVDAQYRTDTEQLAFPVRPELGETDYPWNFATPPAPIRDFYTLPGNTTDLYARCLPDTLGGNDVTNR